MEKYGELGFELKRLWEVRPKVIPIIVGALRTKAIDSSCTWQK